MEMYNKKLYYLLDHGTTKRKFKGKSYDITAVEIYSGSFQMQHNQ